jgi:molybdate/tungstate transport system permease protein
MKAERFGVGTAVLAVATVQVVAFAVASGVDQPTLYVPFALGTAALLGWRADEGWFGVVAAGFGSVLLLALGLPLLAFAARQDLGLVVETALAPEVHRMLFLTVYGPLLAALGALASGVPLAYLLARGFRGQSLVESLVDLPLVVPHSVAGILILFGFGRGGVFPNVPVLTSIVGMILALVFVSAPFAVNAAREAFEAVDENVKRAARSQGASPFETFRRVTLPLAGRGVLTGGVLAWARGVSEFGAVAVVAYTVEFFVPSVGTLTSQHAPVFIFNTYTSRGLAESGAVAAVLLAVSALIFLLIRWVAYDERQGVV